MEVLLRRGQTNYIHDSVCLMCVSDSNGYTVVVRNCVVDDGGTNSETEIGRLTHCGWMRTIKYSGKRMRGCILACETDGCNSAALPVTCVWNVFMCSLVSAVSVRWLAAVQ